MYLDSNEFEAMTGKFIDKQELYYRLEYRCRKLIDTMTFSRLEDEHETREVVKRLMAEMLLEMLAQEEYTVNGGGVYASKSNDGISVSFATRDESKLTQKLRSLIREYLTDEISADGVPLLYRGVYV